MKTNAVQCLAASLAMALAALCGPALAQAGSMFPFVIPWDDSTSGTPTDVSFLNATPAGTHGYIISKNGHFYESKTNTRIRFIGTNFAAKDAFPNHADAEKVAARIAKLGINIVRMHHMDNNGWGTGTNIWDPAYKDHQHIDVGQLDKLDYLISQFKKNGVYVNINLHVSRQFTPEDGFPASVSDINTSFDKRVDEFDRRMIQLQKNYAHDLLTHVNPYTHLSYADDPCVAVVEINNENSLVGDPWATLGAGLDTLPEPFRGELVGDWNAWLTKKYGTDAKLQAAWLQGVTPSGPGIIKPGSVWSIEHQGTSQAEMVPLQTPAEPVVDGPAPPAASPVQVAVSQIDGTDWHVQVHQTGLDFKEGDTYTVSFRAKADAPRTINVNAGLDQADWHNIGLNANAALTTDWKTFHFSFEAHDVVADHGRVAFTLGGQTGTVWISDLQVKPGAEGAGLQPGQSLAKKNIDIPVSATRHQQFDWASFLADTEQSYANEMRAYLKDTLHVHANVICSQISWGGLTGLGREEKMDFADNHAYWQHPSFPHKAWDSKDWTIGNTSQVADLANGGGASLRDLAEYRVAGKPYSISEYNEPAPNDFQAEALPLLATFAAFQDWDIIYLFDYGDYGTGVANDKINGYFAVSSNPAKMAFLPSTAMIFRGMEFAPAKTRVVDTGLDAADRIRDKSAGTAWQAFEAKSGSSAAAPDIFQSQIMLAGPSHFTSTPTAGTDISSPSSIEVTGKADTACYTAISPSTQSVIGFVGGQSITVGSSTFVFPSFGNNFAAMTLAAMDRKPLPTSDRLLLTLVGKVENQGMVWNAARTSVGDQWGHGPTLAEGIPATITLKTRTARHVYILDGTGKRAGDVPATFADGTLTFTVGPQYQTLWYEIAP